MLKKVIVSSTIFHRFLMVLASPNGAKMELFWMVFRKRRFCENSHPSQAKTCFLRFGASKNAIQNDAETHSKKTSQKNMQKLDLGLHFDFPKPPKIHPKSKKVASEDDLKNKLMGLNGRGARPNAPDPARQAQEAS